jgi:transposase
LEGNWRKELPFILQHELNLYQIYQQRIVGCDTELAAHLQTLEDKVEPGNQPPAAKANKRAGSNAPDSLDLRWELYRINGTDLTQIDGINIMNAQTIIAEVGVDMSRFPGEAHFASFPGLCWVHRRPSQAWPTCWPGLFTACCATENKMSTRG